MNITPLLKNLGTKNMKITSIDKTNVKEISEALRKAIKEVADKYGLKRVPHRGTYDADGSRFSFKCEVQVADALSREQSDLKHYATVYGVDPSLEVMVQGKMCMLWGYKTRARKKPFMMKETAKLQEDWYYPLTSEQAVKYFAATTTCSKNQNDYLKKE